MLGLKIVSKVLHVKQISSRQCTFSKGGRARCEYKVRAKVGAAGKEEKLRPNTFFSGGFARVSLVGRS